MQRIEELVASIPIQGISDYFRVSKLLTQRIQAGEVSARSSARIGILSGFTTRGLKEVLQTRCAAAGISSELYVGDYAQYAQEILNPDSGLYRFGPEIVILFVDTFSLLGNLLLDPYEASQKNWRGLVEKETAELARWIELIKSRTKATLLVHNFELPVCSPLGILEAKQEFGFFEALETLNSSLRAALKHDPRAYLIDYDRFCARVGKRAISDPKQFYLADMRLDPAHYPALCEEYLGHIKPLKSILRKCVVVDLDNTLWGGVLGEDGLEGLKLGPTPDGRPFLDFQRALLALWRRGVLLAINSRNNRDEALAAIRSHPHMLLREDCFAAARINWDNKIDNLRAIARELNIGTDSLVFIDDDPANTEVVRQAMPEVLALLLPKDPARYAQTLASLNDLNALQLTKEDRARGRQYAEQRARQDLRESAGDLNSYLRDLAIVATLEPATSFTIPRLAQLTQKTNQFNTTTRRRGEEEIKGLAHDGRHLVVGVSVADRFGDSGLTGLAIVEKGGTTWTIDSLLLSCRVIGRGVEDALLAHVIEQARAASAEELRADFIRTEKNEPAREFYGRTGFSLVEENGAVQRWRYPLSRPFSAPAHITVRELNER